MGTYDPMGELTEPPEREGFRIVFMGRESAGRLDTPAIYRYQCTTCGSLIHVDYVADHHH